MMVGAFTLAFAMRKLVLFVIQVYTNHNVLNIQSVFDQCYKKDILECIGTVAKYCLYQENLGFF